MNVEVDAASGRLLLRGRLVLAGGESRARLDIDFQRFTALVGGADGTWVHEHIANRCQCNHVVHARAQACDGVSCRGSFCLNDRFAPVVCFQAHCTFEQQQNARLVAANLQQHLLAFGGFDLKRLSDSVAFGPGQRLEGRELLKFFRCQCVHSALTGWPQSAGKCRCFTRVGSEFHERDCLRVMMAVPSNSWVLDSIEQLGSISVCDVDDLKAGPVVVVSLLWVAPQTIRTEVDSGEGAVQCHLEAESIDAVWCHWHLAQYHQPFRRQVQ